MARKKTKKRTKKRATRKSKSSKSRRTPRKTKKTQISKKSTSRKFKFKTPKGTFDILPKDQKYWDRVQRLIDNLASAYGFSNIQTPIFEDLELFTKGTGESTDIVQKEMYILRTKGGKRFALRPEFTPPIVRAYIEHGMKTETQPVKLYSRGPIFRHEKPQAGRFRQFHQANFEIIGDQDAINDVSLIYLIHLIFKKLYIKDFTIEINSIGCSECRPDYKKLLVNYYKRQTRKLCKDCRERLKINPFRLLDCKQEKCRQLANNAPQIIDHLCKQCHNHFKEVLEILDQLEIPYILNPHLVRGLDYYTKTVFEFKLEQDDKTGTLAAGGRYDDLVKLLGGKSTPASGVAIGIERVIQALKDQDIKVPEPSPPEIFLVQLGELGKRKSLALFEELRAKGLKVAEALSKNSIKSQLKIADKLGVKIALIFGQKEALENNIIIRDMSSGVQETVPVDRIIKEVKKRLK